MISRGCENNLVIADPAHTLLLFNVKIKHSLFVIWDFLLRVLIRYKKFVISKEAEMLVSTIVTRRYKHILKKLHVV